MGAVDYLPSYTYAIARELSVCYASEDFAKVFKRFRK